MQLTYYNHYDRDADTHDYVLGIITDDTKFIDMYIDDVINPEFLDVVYSQKSFSVEVDAGTATFRKENKKYWYAYKKLKGKLNKAYVGTTQLLTELSICKAVEEVNIAKEPTSSAVTQTSSTVTQKHSVDAFKEGDRVSYVNPDLPYKKNRGIGVITEMTADNLYIVWEDDLKMVCPFSRSSSDELFLVDVANQKIELAGHGKYEDHLQPSLPFAVADDIDSLKREQAMKNMSLAVEIAKERIAELEANLAAVTQERNIALSDLKKSDQDIDKTHEKLLERATELAECKQLLIIRGQELNETFAQLESAYEMNAHLQMSIDSLEVGLKIHQRDYQDLNERHLGVKELHGNALTYIHKLESDIEKLQEYNRIGEKEAFDNLNTFEAVMPIIHQYRVMADGKTKKANPRYAYLIDFLGDINKIS